MLTLAEALAKLREIGADGKAYTTQQLMDLVAQVSIDAAPGYTQGSVTLLYSGGINGVPSDKYIEQMIKDGADIRVIDKTQVGQFLADPEFKKAWLKVTNGETNLLYDATNGPWAQASSRFVAATSGEVRFLGPLASFERQFGQTELKAIINGLTGITSIEGFSINELRSMSLDEAFSAIKVRSGWSAGLSGFKVNAINGALQSVTLGDFLKPAILDSKSYILSHPESIGRFVKFISESLASSERSLLKGMASGVVRKLGPLGALVSLGFAVSDAAEAAQKGDTGKAANIMEHWAVEMAGSELGSVVVGGAVVAIVAGAAALAGVTIAAPVMAALALGAAVIGGNYGSDAAIEAWQSLRSGSGGSDLDLQKKIQNPLTLPDFHIAFGTANGDQLSGTDKNDDMYGGGGADRILGQAGDDILRGDAGSDTLLGGQGNDRLKGGDDADSLNGGEGNDTLEGGDGLDTYAFDGTYGADVIDDHDGQGTIKVDDQVLPAGAAKKVADNVYRDKATGWRFTKINVQPDGTASLVIQKDDSKNSITVKGWKNGLLGISLSETQEDTLPGISIYKGDQRPLIYGVDIFDASKASDTYAWDKVSWNTANGTLNGGKAEANFSDVIEGSAGMDDIQGLGGNDALSGGAGNDKIDGGMGDDLIGGGSGSDTIKGGAGNDQIVSGLALVVGQRIGTTDKWTPPEGKTVYSSGARWGVYKDSEKLYIVDGAGSVPQDDKPDFIDGGAGNDRILASFGNDYVDGGEDDDVIKGLAGNDLLSGGAGADSIYGDATAEVGYLETTPSILHGNDVLDGGKGNDLLMGQGGDDELFGGADKDSLWGDDDDDKTTALTAHGNDYLEGGAGDDQLVGGGKDDELFGGADNDSLWGDDTSDKVGLAFQGNDYLDGEDGNDQLVGGGKDDELFGGKGDDKLFGDDHQNEVAVSAHGKDYLDGEEGNDELVGGGSDDELFGGVGSDTLWGDDIQSSVAASAHGDDYLDGEDGNDTLIGGGKDDHLYGGTGNDVLLGDDSGDKVDASVHGNDHLEGEDGDDSLVGGGKDDELFGGIGNDVLLGDDTEDMVASSAHGKDYLDGGDGNDTLMGGGKDDQLLGGEGNDVLMGDDVQNKVAAAAHGNDLLDGQAGDDLLIGGGLGDTLIGGEGNDTLKGDDDIGNLAAGAHGADKLDGGNGNDVLYGAGGNDTLFGGAGDDWLSGEEQATTAESGQGSALTGNDELMGGDGRDTLLGGVGQDRLDGGADGDTLMGGDGSDTLDGGSGNDFLNGGSGSDVYLFGRGSGQDTIAASTADVDVISFGADIVKANVTLVRSGNNLILSINETNDQLVVQDYFVKGLDVLQFSNGTYLSAGAVEGRIVRSTPGADNLTGYNFADTIRGGDGNDTLNGQGGMDRLEGGSGNDVLNGGVGSNTYVFGLGDGQDTIQSVYDYDTKRNVLQFEASIKPEDVVVRILSNKDLVFMFKSRTEKVTVQGFLNGLAYNPLQEVHFESSPEVWDIQKITDKALTTDSNVPSSSRDVLYGTSGNDVFSGGSTFSEAYGGAGDDTLRGSYFMFGGAGNDTYIMSRDQSMEITIGTEYSGNRDKVLIPYAFSDATFYRDYTAGTGYPDRLNIRLANSAALSDDEYLSINDFFKSQGPDNTIQEIQFTDKTVTRAEVIAMDTVFLQDDNANRVFGYHWSNAIDAKGGDDFIQTYEGADTIKAGTGNDWVYANRGNDVIEGEDGNDTLWGEDGDDLIAGGNGDDYLYGDKGSDTLSGGAGNDVLRGYGGNDVYKFGWGQGNDTILEMSDQASDVDTILLDEGIKETDVSLIQSDNDLILVLGSTVGRPELAVQGYYAARASNFDAKIEVIHFASGVEWRGLDITGRVQSATIDTITGGAGNDVFTVDHGKDVIIEAANGGIDTVNSSVSYVLPDNVENLTLTGIANTAASGNALNNRLTGNAGNNLIYGDGQDTLIGGTGNDIYYASLHTTNALTDQIIELANGGTDTLVTSSYNVILPDNVENLTWVDDSAHPNSYSTSLRTLRGNTGNNIIRVTGISLPPTRIDGGAGADTMNGGGNQDITFVVDNVGDLIEAGGSGTVESSVSYTLGATIRSLVLTGNSTISGRGNDDRNTLDGRLNTGDNLLAGGRGDDTYYIGAGDIVLEYAGEGADTIDIKAADNQPSIFNTYTLPESSNVENLRGDEFSNSLTGNALNNTLIGVAGNDTLKGMAGDDSLIGGVDQDWLEGGLGNDTLAGGMGNNTLVGGAGNDAYQLGGYGSIDRIVEWDGAPNTLDIVYISASFDSVTGIEKLGNDLSIKYNGYYGRLNQAIIQDFFLNSAYTIEQVRFSGNRILELSALQALAVAPAPVSGTAVGNVLVGTAGVDRLSGLAGNDTLYGLDGMDSLYGGIDDDGLDGGAGDDLLSGDAGNDILLGGVGQDTLQGGEGSDTLDGGNGSDIMEGGPGNDVFYVDDVNDQVNDNEGVSTVYVSSIASYEGRQEIIRLIGGGGSVAAKVLGYQSTSLYGNELNNLLKGSAGNDTLNGGLGNDTMAGGDGSDTYFVQDAGDLIVENAYSGIDTAYIQNFAIYTLMDYLEVGVFSSTSSAGGRMIGNNLSNSLTGYDYNDSLEGGRGLDQLIGGLGNDTLNGGEDADTMTGGLGDDTYFVDNAGDSIVETTGQGMDTVTSLVSYTLSANVENLMFVGNDSVIGIGNTLANELTGNAGDNVLIGDLGNDILSGGLGHDTLDGGDGNDTINGEVGEDSMIGGLGNDTYFVDNLDDVIVEVANEGMDTVNSVISWTLGNNLEHLILVNGANINAVGNVLDNTLTGNAGNNLLDAMDGKDTLFGGTGNDTLLGGQGGDLLDGGAGNDLLLGGEGIDTLIGGDGNDTYYVDYYFDLDEGAVYQDKVIETDMGNSGIDTVITSGHHYVLAKNVENLIIQNSGDGLLTSYGNQLNNIITGSDEANTIWARDGNDTIYGGNGNDGLYGEAGNDSLDGGEGDDGLFGGLGTDTLNGGNGNDTYYVTNYWDDNGDLQRDQIIEGDSASSGIDTANTADNNYYLAKNVENLILEAGALAHGNALGNRITGSAFADSLESLAGNDTVLSGAGNDIIWAGDGSDSIEGGDGNDIIFSDNNYNNESVPAFNGNDTINGGLGDDALNDTSTSSNDVYIWGRGQGADTLIDNGGTDRLDILAGVTASQLWLRHVGNNLEISVIGTHDKFTIKNWYLSAANQVESVKLSDGKVLVASKAENLVNAMAVFTPPVTGQTTLPANYQTALNSVIAANWG